LRCANDLGTVLVFIDTYKIVCRFLFIDMGV
jgi:hypothetical protein